MVGEVMVVEMMLLMVELIEDGDGGLGMQDVKACTTYLKFSFLELDFTKSLITFKFYINVICNLGITHFGFKGNLY